MLMVGVTVEVIHNDEARVLPGQLPRVAGAIIGEPSSLLPIRVHNGFIRFRIAAGVGFLLGYLIGRR